MLNYFIDRLLSVIKIIFGTYISIFAWESMMSKKYLCKWINWEFMIEPIEKLCNALSMMSFDDSCSFKSLRLLRIGFSSTMCFNQSYLDADDYPLLEINSKDKLPLLNRLNQFWAGGSDILSFVSTFQICE